MADTRCHRGAHPEDAELFAPSQAPSLQAAVADLAWLLSRGYAMPSALKIVGDRHGLSARQRTAVMRCTCSEDACIQRIARRAEAHDLAGETLLIDGYNVLTTIEAALAGGVVLAAQDSSYRDMASMHGTWRKVEETIPAIDLVRRSLMDLRVGDCTWLLDSPVSNSGRLKAALESAAGDLRWTVELSLNPDVPLSHAREIVATADSVILDRCGKWFPLARHCLHHYVAGAWIVDLGVGRSAR
jgi:hypothetical protein